jgi:hypothetical protein
LSWSSGFETTTTMKRGEAKDFPKWCWRSVVEVNWISTGEVVKGKVVEREFSWVGIAVGEIGWWDGVIGKSRGEAKCGWGDRREHSGRDE